jgi:hypothetical protein
MPGRCPSQYDFLIMRVNDIVTRRFNFNYSWSESLLPVRTEIALRFKFSFFLGGGGAEGRGIKEYA